jgi:xanthine/uracil/vitamin C permease (AzgA family)
MGPIYQETGNPTLVWQVGLFACLMSGLMEMAGAFVGDWCSAPLKVNKAYAAWGT